LANSFLVRIPVVVIEGIESLLKYFFRTSSREPPDLRSDRTSPAISFSAILILPRESRVSPGMTSHNIILPVDVSYTSPSILTLIIA